MSGQLTDDVTWISHCYEVDGRHLHIAAYLVTGDDGAILIDSGSHHHRTTIREGVEQTRGDHPLDALIISHANLPHSSNISVFQEDWPDLEIVGANAAPEIVGLPPETRVEIGTADTVAGRTFTFLEPPLSDLVFTTWPYDHETGVLFTADGFGNFHRPGDCDVVLDGSHSSMPTYEEIRDYHADTFRWLEYTAPKKLLDELRWIFEEYDVSYVAPTHGHPIERSEIEEYFDLLEEAITEIAADATIGPATE